MRFGRLAAAQTSGTRGTEAFQPGARLASVAQHTQGERLCSILPVDRGSRAGDGCAAGAVRWTADTGGVDDGALSWPCLASDGSGRASVAERRIDWRTKRKCFRCSRSTPDGSPRARPACRCALWRISFSSLFITRFYGKAEMWM